jgi:MFS family permease
MFWLIAFRALQGMGAGAVQPVAYAIVGDIYTPTERAKVQGFLSGVFGISAVIGPTLGAFLIEHANWSVVFWVNLPIGVLAMVMLGAFLREQRHQKPPPIDFLASLLLAVGAGALMLVMIQAAQLPVWLLLVLVAAGIVALWALVRHERHVPAPMLPIRFWTNKVIALGNFGSFAIGMVMMSVVGFLPTYLQGVMGRGPSAIGAAVAAMSISWTVASVLAGRLMLHTSYRASAMLGGAMLALGSAVLVFMTPQSSVAWAVLGALVVGIGMGSCNTTYLVSVQGAAALRERGAATASNMFMRIVGQATGAALYGALVNAGHRPLRAARRARRRPPDGSGLRQALGPAEMAALSEAMAAALRNVYVAAALGGLIVLFLGFRFPAALRPATLTDSPPRTAR